jgi:hypothetical protein
MHLIPIHSAIAQTDLLTVLRQSASCIIFIPQAPNIALKTSNTDTAWLALFHLPILLIC